MARPIYPQWPAQPPPGHPFQDEIDRRALRSFLDIASATPEEVAEYHKQEAIRAQDARAREDEYQRYAAESAKINRQEAKRQAWEAMLQQQGELTQELDDLRQASRDWEFENPGWDKAERTKAQLESLYQRTNPRTYSDDDLMAASNKMLSINDLDWLEGMDEDLERGYTFEDDKAALRYLGLLVTRDAAKALIDAGGLEKRRK